MAMHKGDYGKEMKGYSTTHPEKTTSPGAKLGKIPEGSWSGAGANVKEGRAVSGVAPRRGSHRKGSKGKKGYAKAPYM